MDIHVIIQCVKVKFSLLFYDQYDYLIILSLNLNKQI